MLFVELLVCGEPSTSLLEKDVKSTTYSVGRRSLFCRGLGSGDGPKGKRRHLRSRGPWNQQPDLFVQAPCSDSRQPILTLWSFSTVTGGLRWISMMNFMESFSCKQDKSNHMFPTPGAKQLAERQESEQCQQESSWTAELESCSPPPVPSYHYAIASSGSWQHRHHWWGWKD